jgi:hypothetical protein
MPFTGCRFARADYPYVFATIGVSDYQYSASTRGTNRNESAFGHGMVGVVIRDRQGIAKNGRGLLEPHPMLTAIVGCLGRVPLEIHSIVSNIHWNPTMGNH